MSASGQFRGAAHETYPLVRYGGIALHSAGFSAQGVREYNEDRLGYVHNGQYACWALADGLGGHHGGARAAGLAVEAGLHSLERSAIPRLEDKLKQAISNAHAAIVNEQRRNAEFAGMRSTLVLLGVDGESLAWAHAGDSRLYHFRDGRLAWRTRDHSAVQLLVSAGEVAEADIARHPDRSRLVSTLGGDSSLLISARRAELPPRSGDVMLLASDGLWEHFDNLALEQAVVAAEGPEELLDILTQRVAAEALPRQDNYSAIAVYIET
ncbi:MAG: PP2C family protein-serine/threonine phosphatase [Bacillota bacterium]